MPLQFQMHKEMQKSMALKTADLSVERLDLTVYFLFLLVHKANHKDKNECLSKSFLFFVFPFSFTRRTVLTIY